MTSRWRRHVFRCPPFAVLLAIFLLALAPAAGAQTATKLLYPYDNGDLTRTPQAATNTAGVTVASKGGTKDYTLTPAITAAKPLVLSSGTITVTLVSSSASGATLTAALFNGATQIGATSAAVASSTTPAAKTYSITLGSNYTLSSGSLVLRVTNTTNGAGKDATVYQYYGSNSKVSFLTTTFVKIDSLAIYSATYPAVTTRATYAPNNSVFIRATVSDPFGAADVTATNLTVTNPAATVKVGPNQAMTEVVAARTATSKTFEYEYPLPSNAVVGTWTVSATALEGTEGTVTHTLGTTFAVAVPALTITKSHSGNFTAGTNGSYSILVHNGGGTTITGRTTVVDTLSSSYAYVSGGGGATGWVCSAVGQVVTCYNDTDIPAGTDLTALPLTVAVSGSAPASVDNAASLSNPDIGAGTVLSNTDGTTILHPDLSTSSMIVADLNGGDADPGDVLHYTLTLTESAGAAVNDASVVDNMPAGVTGFNVTSYPGGATNASTGSQLNITGIDFGASGSATVEFEVTVGGSAVPGDTIDHTATVGNPNGPGASVDAPTVTVSQSQLAASGNKVLYLYDNLGLTRTPQPATTSAGTTVNAGSTGTWTLTPVIPAGESLVLSAGSIGVNLMVNTNYSSVNLQARLMDGATVIGSSTVQNINTGTTIARSFAITLASDYTMSGNTLTLQLINSASGNKNLTVYQYSGGRSTITFGTSTVVNVDSVAIYSGASPAVTTKTYYLHGDTLYVRAVVSDPFGYADVSAAEVTLTDSIGVLRVTADAMSEVVAARTAASKTFEYAYVLPADARLGTWTAGVVAHEGTEGSVTHTGNVAFDVHGRITLSSAWAGATAGTTVDLAIAGADDIVAGSSVAPSTVTPATATSVADATITLSENYTVGLPGDYTMTLACSKDSDSTSVSVTGLGLSRTITMPVDSSVACTWTNSKTVPLTILKASIVRSDPTNLASNPKAIPGAIVEYQITVTNPAVNAVDADSVIVTDPLPSTVELVLNDLSGPGSGPVEFDDGSPSSGMTYTFTALGNSLDDVDFSDSGGWGHVPNPNGNGVDSAITGIRIHPKGAFNANNAQFTIKFRVRVK